MELIKLDVIESAHIISIELIQFSLCRFILIFWWNWSTGTWHCNWAAAHTNSWSHVGQWSLNPVWFLWGSVVTHKCSYMQILSELVYNETLSGVSFVLHFWFSIQYRNISEDTTVAFHIQMFSEHTTPHLGTYTVALQAWSVGYFLTLKWGLP